MTLEQRAFRNVLIGAANKAVQARRVFEDTPATDELLWSARAYDVSEAATVLSLLSTIDANWDKLIRTYTGPGK
jgi:hypothetical protein